jgi:parallel beta-helix repeat protein
MTAAHFFKTTRILAILLLLSPGGPALSNDFICDNVVTPGGSIQAAIDIASAGDKICVEPGVYTEDLSITKSLELVGVRASDPNNDAYRRPIIEGVATVPAASFPLAIPNIDIQANDVSIHRFVIKSPVVGAEEYSSGIVLTGKNIKICKNRLVVGTGDVSQAIQTYRQTNAPPGLRDISGLHICKNRFTHLEPATGLGAYEGIFINPQSDPVDTTARSNTVVIEKNRFSGNLIRSVTTQRSGTVISKNRMRTQWTPPAGLSTFPRGIQLSAAAEAPPLPAALSTDHLVEKNRAYDIGGVPFAVGILVRDGVTASGIEKNTVKGAATYGISVDGDSNLIEKNTVKDSGVGIALGPASEANDVEKNRVENSETWDLQNEGNNNSFDKNKCDTSLPDGLCRHHGKP